MTPLAGIALNTFRETIRDRLLYALFAFAIAIIGASSLASSLTIAQDRKIVLDLALAAMEFFAVAIAVFVGTNMVFKEVDKRTVYVVLTKPVARTTFLVGKFLGLGLALAALVTLMGLAVMGLAWAKGGFAPELMGVFGLLGLQLVVLVAVTLFFSSFTSPLLSMILSFSLYFIGHNTEALRGMARHASPAMRLVVEGLYYVLPNLSTFEAKNAAVYGAAVAPWRWVWAVAYALAYTVALLATASALFERREF